MDRANSCFFATKSFSRKLDFALADHTGREADHDLRPGSVNTARFRIRLDGIAWLRAKPLPHLWASPLEGAEVSLPAHVALEKQVQLSLPSVYGLDNVVRIRDIWLRLGKLPKLNSIRPHRS